MRILFLYTELAEYFLKCCEALAASCEVHIVRWAVNREAPFDFIFPPGVTVHEKGAQTLPELLNSLQPSMIVCSGWIDRDYLRALKKWNKKSPVVLALDTHWTGSPRQKLAAMLGPFFIRDRFTHAWVPGKPQENYALKLGFKNNRIYRGFYSCDLEKFNAVREEHRSFKSATFPKRFLYIGRYYAFKGVEDLWEAFASLSAEEKNGWELWCLGTGKVRPSGQDGIRHFGFVQPRDIAPLLGQTGVFVLPSRFEPWGVVVQEMAAAGFPLLLSDAVGAAEAFLRPGENGYSFTRGKPDELRELLKKVTRLDDKQLLLMGERSHLLAQQISPLKWARTALEICNGREK